MFTGIVRRVLEVKRVEKKPGLIHYGVAFTKDLLENLQLGASVSIDGVCQTVAGIAGNLVWFDAIQETLNRTTMKFLREGIRVNAERSAKFGDEIGGHILSGHVYGTALIKKIHRLENNHIVAFECNPEWTKYFFPKGYIAIDGVSLTLVEVDAGGLFTVHLIPETLRLTTFGIKKEGDFVNIELDSQTQAIVDTVERVMGKGKSQEAAAHKQS